MQNLLQLISDKTVSNKTLSSTLKSLPAPKIQQKQKIKAQEFRQKIHKQIISNKILPNVKQSQFSQQIEYKKVLAQQYLRMSMKKLDQQQKSLIDNIQCLKCLQELLQIKSKMTKGKLSQRLPVFIKYEQKYFQLKRKLKNPKLLQQVNMIYEKLKSQILNSLQKLIERKNNTSKILIDNSIDEVIPLVSSSDVFIHWMFTMFENIIVYNEEQDKKDKSTLKITLTLKSLKKEKQSNINNQTQILLKIKVLSFQSPDNVHQFIQDIKQTLEIVKDVQNKIKVKLESSISYDCSQDQKFKHQQILELIKTEQLQYWQKVRQDILPSIYLFNLSNRNRIYQIFQIQQKDKINSMPSMLLSYKYCKNSKLTKDQFNQITQKIVELLIEQQNTKSDKQEFDQVCFFLHASIELTDSNNKGFPNADADLSFLLVSQLITKSIDKIDYQKIQKLLKIQRAIRWFKLRK